MTNKPSAELPAEMKNIKILIGHSFWQSLSPTKTRSTARRHCSVSANANDDQINFHIKRSAKWYGVHYFIHFTECWFQTSSNRRDKDHATNLKYTLPRLLYFIGRLQFFVVCSYQTKGHSLSGTSFNIMQTNN